MKTENGFLKKLKKSDKLGLLIAFVLMLIIFQTLTGGNYLLKVNIINILVSCAIAGLVTIGESFLLICGHVDLSPGSVSAFSGVLAALLMKNGVNMWVTILIVIGVGTLIGLVNAILVNELKLEAFIATLAM